MFVVVTFAVNFNTQMKKVTFIALSIGLLTACNASNNQKQETPEQGKEEVKETKIEESTSEAAPNAMELMKEIDAYRNEVEDNLDKMKSMSADMSAMREQVKQKWSNIEFYMDGDRNLKRVKTYPHEGISKRTEEFYFKEGQLVNAVIEDDGSSKGKEKTFMGKLYYYHDGDLIGEKNMTQESEYSIRDSDGERLLQEAREYIEIFNSMNE